MQASMFLFWRAHFPVLFFLPLDGFLCTILSNFARDTMVGVYVQASCFFFFSGAFCFRFVLPFHLKKEEEWIDIIAVILLVSWMDNHGVPIKTCVQISAHILVCWVCRFFVLVRYFGAIITLSCFIFCDYLCDFLSGRFSLFVGFLFLIDFAIFYIYLFHVPVPCFFILRAFFCRGVLYTGSDFG